jgi:hypothetical protein
LHFGFRHVDGGSYPECSGRGGLQVTEELKDKWWRSDMYIIFLLSVSRRARVNWP